MQSQNDSPDLDFEYDDADTYSTEIAGKIISEETTLRCPFSPSQEEKWAKIYLYSLFIVTVSGKKWGKLVCVGWEYLSQCIDEVTCDVSAVKISMVAP